MPVEYVDITDAEDAGQRIDNFLLLVKRAAPTAYLQDFTLRRVRVNGGRIKPGHRLQLDDRIRIPPVTVKQNNRYKWQMLRYSAGGSYSL